MLLLLNFIMSVCMHVSIVLFGSLCVYVCTECLFVLPGVCENQFYHQLKKRLTVKINNNMIFLHS